MGVGRTHGWRERRRNATAVHTRATTVGPRDLCCRVAACAVANRSIESDVSSALKDDNAHQ
jgi:hypothetical protein